MMVSQSFRGAATPFSLLLPAASCSALSAQPLAGAWTALNHAAYNMFLLKIIVVINALSFSAAICLDARHNGYSSLFPKAGRRRKERTEAAACAFSQHLCFGWQLFVCLGGSPLLQRQQEALNFLTVKGLEKRHAWKKILMQRYNFS